MFWAKKEDRVARDSEDVVDVIVALFTDEEIENLNKDRFRRFFVNCCRGSTPLYSLSDSREIAKDLIKDYRAKGYLKKDTAMRGEMIFELRSTLFSG